MRIQAPPWEDGILAENQEESVAYLGGEVGGPGPSNEEVVAGYLEGAPSESGEVAFVDEASPVGRSKAEADTQDISTQEIVGYLGPENDGDGYGSYASDEPDAYSSVAGTLEGQSQGTEEISGYLEGGSQATQEISGYLESPEPTIQGYLQPPEQVGYLDSGVQPVDETTNVGDYGQTDSEEDAESGYGDSYGGGDSYADSYDAGAESGYAGSDTAQHPGDDTGNFEEGFAPGSS